MSFNDTRPDPSGYIDNTISKSTFKKDFYCDMPNSFTKNANKTDIYTDGSNQTVE